MTKILKICLLPLNYENLQKFDEWNSELPNIHLNTENTPLISEEMLKC